MFSRTVRNPLVVGLGAGFIVLVGGTPMVLAVTPSPSASGGSPSSSPSTKPTATTTATATATPTATPPPSPTPIPKTSSPPVLSAAFSNPAVQPHDDVSLTVTVQNISSTTASGAYVRLSADGGQIVQPALGSSGSVGLGALSAGSSDPVSVTVHMPAATGTVRITAKPSANGAADTGPYVYTISVTPASASSSPSPSYSPGVPTNAASLPFGGSGPASISPSNARGVPSDTSAALPEIAPTTDVRYASNSQAMRDSSPGPYELTLTKLASMQAAWLAALFVAFSLLLTQVRLGRATGKRGRIGIHRKARGGFLA